MSLKLIFLYGKLILYIFWLEPNVTLFLMVAQRFHWGFLSVNSLWFNFTLAFEIIPFEHTQNNIEPAYGRDNFLLEILISC